jgi:hypothetical protein
MRRDDPPQIAEFLLTAAAEAAPLCGAKVRQPPGKRALPAASRGQDRRGRERSSGLALFGVYNKILPDADHVRPRKAGTDAARATLGRFEELQASGQLERLVRSGDEAAIKIGSLQP